MENGDAEPDGDIRTAKTLRGWLEFQWVAGKGSMP